MLVSKSLFNFTPLNTMSQSSQLFLEARENQQSNAVLDADYQYQQYLLSLEEFDNQQVINKSE